LYFKAKTVISAGFTLKKKTISADCTLKPKCHRFSMVISKQLLSYLSKSFLIKQRCADLQNKSPSFIFSVVPCCLLTASTLHQLRRTYQMVTSVN